MVVVYNVEENLKLFSTIILVSDRQDEKSIFSWSINFLHQRHSCRHFSFSSNQPRTKETIIRVICQFNSKIVAVRTKNTRQLNFVGFSDIVLRNFRMTCRNFSINQFSLRKNLRKTKFGKKIALMGVVYHSLGCFFNEMFLYERRFMGSSLPPSWIMNLE